MGNASAKLPESVGAACAATAQVTTVVAVRISAKVDYALRAMAELAAAGGGPVKGERLASAQSIPPKFLENILADLRQAGLIRSQRGSEGGYWLVR
ncbi:MAG: Predicted transcriptional regulator of sulfate adenylyltransferase, Rrf2 family, partial [uncultured Solirubrobacteraceae bacterium]